MKNYKPADYTYIGKQLDEQGKEIHLFNCEYCHSTISNDNQMCHLKQYHCAEWIDNVMRRKKDLKNLGGLEKKAEGWRFIK